MDTEPRSRTHKLVGVERADVTDSMYTVSWRDGHSSRYPYVWLLDNCRCSECYLSSCYQRKILMKDVDPDVEPVAEEITEDGGVFKVTWPNNHIGEYPSPWLRHHQFDKTDYDPIADLKRRPWGSELSDVLPRFGFDELLKNDDELLNWLTALHEIGFAMVVDAPTKSGAVEEIGKRVAYLKRTNYGTTFQVFAKFNSSNVAYTSAELGLHADLPYFNYTPGVQMLHCIRQTKASGGDNQFSDGYNTALILKKHHPEAYELLKTVTINFRCCGRDTSEEYHLITGRTIINEDSEGNFKSIYYNNPARASYMKVPVEQVKGIYRAIRIFHQTLDDNNINIKLSEGEIATFNKTRVTHGRSGFVVDETSNEEIVRHYEGGYLDWDQIYSKMRVLREKKNGEKRI